MDAHVDALVELQPFNSAVQWCYVSPDAIGVGRIGHDGGIAGSDIEAAPVG